jgi:hypothetical protein
MRAKTDLKTAAIETVKPAKKRQKDGLQPSFQSHQQEGHNDCRFTGMIQRRHDLARTVTSFTLTELPFNGDSVDFILMGQLFKGFNFVLVFFCLFRWSTQSGY